MRALVVMCVVAGCTKEQPDPPRYDPPAPPVDALTGPRPVIVDAPAPIPADADTSNLPIDVPTLAMAGPYPSLAASCAAAAPCGELEVDEQGKATKLPTVPDCTAVLDLSQDRVSRVPKAYGSAGPTELARAIPGGELRIGGVQCAVAKGMRGESSEHYVFLKRADGWWRTEKPVFEHSYNEKYCDGSMYLMWNIKAARTILGIAGSRNCLACMKQMYSDTVTEVMLRVEPAGVKPRVFAPLPVGVRTLVHDEFRAATDPTPPNDDECKVGATATSVKETWTSDDEVTLAGVAAANGGPLTTKFTFGWMSAEHLARAGHYRFPR